MSSGRQSLNSSSLSLHLSWNAGNASGCGATLEVGIAQFTRHALRSRMLHRVPEPGDEAVPLEHGRFDDQFAHHVRMPDSHEQGDVSPVAVPEEICPVDMEIFQESGGVFGRLLEAEGTIDIRGVTVSLLLEGDDPPGLGKGRQDLSERGVDRRASAVKQDKWRVPPAPRPPGLVIKIKKTHFPGGGGVEVV